MYFQILLTKQYLFNNTLHYRYKNGPFPVKSTDLFPSWTDWVPEYTNNASSVTALCEHTSSIHCCGKVSATNKTKWRCLLSIHTHIAAELCGSDLVHRKKLKLSSVPTLLVFSMTASVWIPCPYVYINYFWFTQTVSLQYQNIPSIFTPYCNSKSNCGSTQIST